MSRSAGKSRFSKSVSKLTIFGLVLGSIVLPITQANATTCVAPQARIAEVGGDGAEELFLGGQFIELGIGNLGSFGTSQPAPSPSQSPSALDFYQKAGFEDQVGIRADFDGFCSGTDHVVDYIMPNDGVLNESFDAYGIAFRTANEDYFQFVSTLGTANKSANMRTVTTEDVVISNESLGGLLQAKIETTFKKPENVDFPNGIPVAKLTQTIFFNNADKFFETQVTIENLSDEEWTDVRYARSLDPDNTAFSLGGSYETKNVLVQDVLSEALIIQAQAIDSDSSDVVAASGGPIPIFFYTEELAAFGSVAVPMGGSNPFDAFLNVTGDESQPNDSAMQMTIAMGGVINNVDNAQVLTPGGLFSGASASSSFITNLDNSIATVVDIETRIVKPPVGGFVGGSGSSVPNPRNDDETESIGKLGPGEGVEFTSVAGLEQDYPDALFLEGVLWGQGLYGSHPVPFLYDDIMAQARDVAFDVCIEQTLTYRLYPADEFPRSFFDDTYLASASVQLLPDPSCATVTPDFGPTAGGTVITISGADFDFDENSTVSVNGVTCTTVTRISDTEIECVTPAGINGVVDVQVSDSNGTTLLEGAFRYTEPCAASPSNIQTSAGLFNLSGVELCFDKGSDPNDNFLSQLSGRDNFGMDREEGWTFDYEDVAVGVDKILNALLTVSVVNKLEDDTVDRVDRFRTSQGFGYSNKWIHSRIYYLALEAGDQDDRYVEYTLIFYDKSDDQKTPVTVSNLSTTVYDIDSYQFFESTNVDSYLLSRDTFLTASRLGSNSAVRFAEMDGDASNIQDDFARVTIKLANSNQFKFKLGISNLETEDFGSATFGLDFSGGPAWVEEPVVNAGAIIDRGSPVTFRSVTFDANGGTGTAQAVRNYTAFALPLNALVRPGFTFKGWNTKADGSGVAYADQGIYSFVSDVTLFAQWTPVQAALKAKRFISPFAGDRAILTPRMKTSIASWVRALPSNATITCEGSTSGLRVTAFDRRLAQNRAKNVCNEAVKVRSDLKYSIKLNPSSATRTSARHVWMTQN